MIYLFEAGVGLTSESAEFDEVASADVVVPKEFDTIVYAIRKPGCRLSGSR